jgi:hypothetical protein
VSHCKNQNKFLCTTNTKRYRIFNLIPIERNKVKERRYRTKGRPKPNNENIKSYSSISSMVESWRHDVSNKGFNIPSL